MPDEAHPVPQWVMDLFGYSGGFVLAVCLVPQIYKVFLTKSAEDISYGWTSMYLLGTSLLAVYLVLEGSVAAYVPLFLEIAMVVVLMAMKGYYDKQAASKQAGITGAHGSKGGQGLTGMGAGSALDGHKWEHSGIASPHGPATADLAANHDDQDRDLEAAVAAVAGLRGSSSEALLRPSSVLLGGQGGSSSSSREGAAMAATGGGHVGALHIQQQ